MTNAASLFSLRLPDFPGPLPVITGELQNLHRFCAGYQKNFHLELVSDMTTARFTLPSEDSTKKRIF
ncbi:hypothetical protein TNCV_4831351 [Trichonephila clavipes]|nr:hypothetical protein TNCV_4831351 [Trichonephila clavipes]